MAPAPGHRKDTTQGAPLHSVSSEEVRSRKYRSYHVNQCKDSAIWREDRCSGLLKGNRHCSCRQQCKYWGLVSINSWKPRRQAYDYNLKAGDIVTDFTKGLFGLKRPSDEVLQLRDDAKPLPALPPVGVEATQGHGAVTLIDV